MTITAFGKGFIGMLKNIMDIWIQKNERDAISSSGGGQPEVSEILRIIAPEGSLVTKVSTMSKSVGSDGSGGREGDTDSKYTINLSELAAGGTASDVETFKLSATVDLEDDDVRSNGSGGSGTPLNHTGYKSEPFIVKSKVSNNVENDTRSVTSLSLSETIQPKQISIEIERMGNSEQTSPSERPTVSPAVAAFYKTVESVGSNESIRTVDSNTAKSTIGKL